MPISLLQQFLVVTLISTIISSDAHKKCLDEQKTLLLELKNNLTFNSAASRKLVQWNRVDDCCEWEGVECDASGHVTSLQLDYEGVSGGIENSSSLVSLKYLEKLSLVSCNLHKFPDFIRQSNLSFLDLSQNKITGEIPSWIWEIGNGALYHLNLSSNLLVDLQKPYHIPSFLAELDLHSNHLRGEVPLLPRGASYIDFSNNKFDKPIPIDFVSSNFFLIFLSIANNTISGSIPSSICSASTIQVLDFRLNNMSGSIPPCVVESISNLQVLNLKRNNISGDIPDKFSTSCGLRYFDLSNNNLGGSFPRSLINCQSLEVINVGQNKIEDSFPCMLSSRLRALMLRSNEFQGELKCGESFPNLEVMDISFNNFSGELHHTSFSSWRKMARDNKAPVKKKMGINVVRPDFYYSTSELLFLGIFNLIDLSSNNFRGEIPDAIGDLRSLTVLNLSHNALTGIIPKSFGNMRSLEALDLSRNQLTGVMPEELTNLTWLAFFSVSYNKLVGEIPLSTQFQTFSDDSFMGNSGLCGWRFRNSCNISKSGDGNELSSQTQQSAAHALAYVYVVAFATILSLLCQSP